MSRRQRIIPVLRDLNPCIGAEVGVYQGTFTETLLAETGVECLYCVDWWNGEGMVRPYNGNITFATTLVRLIPYWGRVRVMRTHSLNAARELAADGIKLDFAYIDADHSEAGALADFRAWAPLIRPGGIIAGDDYKNGMRRGVKAAVNEYFDGQTINTTGGRCENWWVTIG